ncbi:hypothetical protein H6F43_09900 [Leptolyngbya sp. FACHB-36]|uniref:hypothetical protein n=1 Tax=Leptolyngbya sp. FACHB-36 TaxID=2692808 RepID=UPI00167FEAFE|nr:hypothetical protein [Leptolyngbya sp. FACHB-36]MBD2020500.1 hypothetical protein [Leptolyngbya sp. FACHB-36]
MAFIRLQENLTINTQYIIKVKWKLNPEQDTLTGTVFLAEDDKPIAVQGDAAYHLWDTLHPEERPDERLPQHHLTQPHLTEAPIADPIARRLRRQW